MFYYSSIDTFKDIMVILMCLLKIALEYVLYAEWVNFPHNALLCLGDGDSEIPPFEEATACAVKVVAAVRSSHVVLGESRGVNCQSGWRFW